MNRLDQSLDIAFSISVVEHVPTPELSGFFAACRDLLRPGGLMLNLIDYYIGDSAPDSFSAARLKAYLSPLQRGFKARNPSAVLDTDVLHFETWMAGNPDNVMASWNRSVPVLRPVRESHQSVTLLMEFIRG